MKLLISYNYRLRRRTVSRWCSHCPGSDCFLTLSIIHDPKRKHTLIKINNHHRNIAYTQGQQLQTTGAVSIRRDVISCLQITRPPAYLSYRGPSPSCLLFSKSSNHYYYTVNPNKLKKLECGEWCCGNANQSSELILPLQISSLDLLALLQHCSRVQCKLVLLVRVYCVQKIVIDAVPTSKETSNRCLFHVRCS